MTYETLQTTLSDGILTLQINRPKALNALNDQVLRELLKCFRDIRRGGETKAVIITGAGDKAFVAGADIAVMKEMTAVDATHFVELGHKCMHAIESCDVPVVAAVNGFALGGGLELALACDFIYASKNAKMGLPEVNLGIFPGFGGTQRLSRLIGKNQAKELVFTASILSADQALALGIVNKVFEPAELLPEVTKTLKIILQKGPVAVSLAKKVITEGCDLSLEAGLKLEERTFPLTFATEDKTEGVAAFLEKRQAAFTGK